MSKKLCPICMIEKKKRECKLEQFEKICINCCTKKQHYYCEGCSYYEQGEHIFFSCQTCGAVDIDDEPSTIAKLMTIEVFPLNKLEGDYFKDERPVSGEIYRTTLVFPFHGEINTPIWFLFDPYSRRSQLIQAEIIEVRDRSLYSAEVEMFVYNNDSINNIPKLFPESEINGSLRKEQGFCRFGSLEIREDGELNWLSSMNQDGGNWAVITNTGESQRLILFAEGWFNHWRYYLGNIVLNSNSYHELFLFKSF